MGAKFVRTTSAIWKRDERKLLPRHFTACIVDVHPYKKYFASALQGATKTVKFVKVVPKTEGSATTCAHRNAIMPKSCNF